MHTSRIYAACAAGVAIAVTCFVGLRTIEPLSTDEEASDSTNDVRGVSVSQRPSSTDTIRPDLSQLSSQRQEETIPPEVADRIKQGHYVLYFEHPLAKKAFGDAVKASLTVYQNRISQEYDHLFRELGVDDGIQEKLKSHLLRIEQARSEAENYLIQLDRAKNAYDAQARQMFTAEQYQKYRDVEATRPALREFDAIKQYFTTSGREPMSPNEEEVLLTSLKQSKQTPELDGPYGRGVRAMDGREKVISALHEDLARLQGEHAFLFQALPDTEKWSNLRTRVGLYYEGLFRRKEKEIDFVLGPPPTPPPDFVQ